MTHDDLKSKRLDLRFTQDEMASHLNGTSVSTYRKWEQGLRKVPSWVDQFFSPKEMILKGLSVEEIIELSEIAKRNKMPVADLISGFIKEGIKRGMIMIVLAIVAWQAFSPDNHAVRKLGSRGRRGDEVEGMMDAIDSGEG